MELKSGKKAPSFSLPSDSGAKVSLSEYLGKFVVIYFYPKDMTPGCTQESCDFGSSYKEIQKLGAVVLGVSRDPVESHQKFKLKYKLPFSLLSDSSGKVCEKYGVWKEKSLYGRKFMGIERTTVLVGKDGKIVKVYPKVKVKGHVDEVISDLKTLR
ncbi:MAG: thioredoxin-dependent thiol peroxidase [Bdellovibrionales bacterium]|nr:thioredoxin-dependent thiol peroxidase [Bdellovibrionales bacterium]